MRDDQRGKDERAGSPDRKTRVDGDRVIHTTKGTPYHGDRYENPRGLTTEQAEDQRAGVKLDERQTREAAQGENQPTANGDPSAHRRPPIEHPRGGTDEVAEQPYGRKGSKQSR